MLRSKALLRNTLLANAGLSGVVGLILIAASDSMAGLLGPGIPASLLFVDGFVLLGFAIAVALIARESQPNPAWASGVIALDVLWVIGSVVLLAAFPGLFSSLGFWLIAAQAAIVADFALLQYLGLRNLTRDDGAAAVSAA